MDRINAAAASEGNALDGECAALRLPLAGESESARVMFREEPTPPLLARPPLCSVLLLETNVRVTVLVLPPPMAEEAPPSTPPRLPPAPLPYALLPP